MVDKADVKANPTRQVTFPMALLKMRHPLFDERGAIFINLGDHMIKKLLTMDAR